MRDLRSFLILFTLMLAAGQPSTAAAQSGNDPITPRDLWAMGRVGAPAISPDGTRIAYPVTWYDVEADRGNSDVWMVGIEGGEAVQLTSSPGTDTSPAWSPDGKWIAFVSTRGGDGPQIYLLPASGGEARRLTSVDGGATGPVWSRDGTRILVVSEVWPEGDEQAERLRALSEGTTDAKIYDELMYRHWDTWEDGMRSHVFMVEVESGEARDLTPGPFDTPPISLGGFQDYDLSPDGTELAFVRNTDVPTSVGTGNDIWLVPVNEGDPTLMTGNDANDTAPQYSPDGKYIAYLAMERPGFEADRTQIILFDRATRERRSLTRTLDRSVADFIWAPDSGSLTFTCQDRIYRSIYRVAIGGGAVEQITSGRYFSGLALTPDGRRMVALSQTNDMPSELFAMALDGSRVRQLTRTNDALLARLSLDSAEVFTFEGARGDEVEGFLVRPPGFDPAKKYPLIYLVHGGPQGAWSDVFHYRWNANMFAAPGYVVLAVNPRGSTGYGQQFTDEITGDWGGKVYEDLMNGLDAALERYPFIDETRMAATGASYGGYMMNWFEGHTTRFRTLVNHDGVTNTVSMYGSTEELWFPEWEFGGLPWENPRDYERWNPLAYVEDFQTPMLIIHGGLDYRVPLGQGLEMFTALRRTGVRARLLYFPDEGHWVLRPQNAMVWWETIYDWLAEYLKE